MFFSSCCALLWRLKAHSTNHGRGHPSRTPSLKQIPSGCQILIINSNQESRLHVGNPVHQAWTTGWRHKIGTDLLCDLGTNTYLFQLWYICEIREGLRAIEAEGATKLSTMAALLSMASTKFLPTHSNQIFPWDYFSPLIFVCLFV